MRLAPAALIGALLAALVLGAPAAAWPESAAPDLRDDVRFVGHAPDVPAAGAQFTVHLALAETATVDTVQLQVCIIDRLVCIIPQRNATLTDGVWTYDTASFTPIGADGPYPWPGGSRIGIQWFLDGEPFPDGPELTAPECEGREIECYAAHYFEFRTGTEASVPTLPLVAALAALAVLALGRRGPMPAGGRHGGHAGHAGGPHA